MPPSQRGQRCGSATPCLRVEVAAPSLALSSHRMRNLSLLNGNLHFCLLTWSFAQCFNGQSTLQRVHCPNPLKHSPKAQHKNRGNLGAARKKEQDFLICFLEMGTTVMWLGHMEHTAGCRTTKQELPPWTIGTSMFWKPKKKTEKTYNWKKRKDRSFTNSPWSTHVLGLAALYFTLFWAIFADIGHEHQLP